MAAFNKYNSGVEALVEAINAGSDTWRVILSNTAPDVTDVAQSDASELTTSGGYTVNGGTFTATKFSNIFFNIATVDPLPFVPAMCIVGGNFL